MSDRWITWQRQTARWLREDTGLFPHAEHCGRFAREKAHGDLLHIGDRIAEDTLEAWGGIRAKLAQAEHAAKIQGFSQWFVWKPLRGASPAEVAQWWELETGEKLPAGKPVSQRIRTAYREAHPSEVGQHSVLVFRADVGWTMMVRLDDLEAEVEELRAERDEALARAEESYHRGWEAGRRMVEVIAEGGVL